ncbi:MAG: hypothetical protein K0S26_1744 [Bacteroidota bacterium]|nr:hypothetical protein [Bacteroidota bacterium]
MNLIAVECTYFEQFNNYREFKYPKINRIPELLGRALSFFIISHLPGFFIVAIWTVFATAFTAVAAL